MSNDRQEQIRASLAQLAYQATLVHKDANIVRRHWLNVTGVEYTSDTITDMQVYDLLRMHDKEYATEMGMRYGADFARYASEEWGDPPVMFYVNAYAVMHKLR